MTCTCGHQLSDHRGRRSGSCSNRGAGAKCRCTGFRAPAVQADLERTNRILKRMRAQKRSVAL